MNGASDTTVESKHFKAVILSGSLPITKHALHGSKLHKQRLYVIVQNATESGFQLVFECPLAHCKKFMLCFFHWFCIVPWQKQTINHHTVISEIRCIFGGPRLLHFFCKKVGNIVQIAQLQVNTDTHTLLNHAQMPNSYAQVCFTQARSITNHAQNP